MDNQRPNGDLKKDSTIRKAIIRRVVPITLVTMLLLILLGILLKFPWQLTLGLTLSAVPFFTVSAILGHKISKQMYK